MNKAGIAPVPDLVSGRYRLLEVIGAGGMGRVWLADDELLDRRVAIKEIKTPTDVTAAQLRDLRIRTMREARAAARLGHPGVVTIFDVIWRPGQSLIVMEYVPSRSLHDAVRQDGPLPHGEAARIGLQVLSALRAAHRVGVLHRDVKPHNVLLAQDGRVVLTDFGLATFEGADTGREPLMGSPQFVAPERLVPPGDSGESADLWSLATTLYAAIEGRPPFVRDSTEATLQAIMHEPPHPMRYPGALTPVLERVLQKDPAERPPAGQLEAELRQLTWAAVIPRQAARGMARVTPAPEPPSRKVPGLPSRKVPGLPSRKVAGPPSREVPSPPLRKVRGLPSRRAVIAGLTAAGLLAGGAVGTAVAVANTRDDGKPIFAVRTPPPFQPCGFIPKNETDAAGPALPNGWLSHADPAGFTLAVPAGWTRSVDRTTICFSDPSAGRAFIVDTAAPLTRTPLDYWVTAEQTERHLPEYHRVSMGVLLLKRGGADWEYSWGPGHHTRRVLVATAADRAYLLRWTTSEEDWTLNVPVQQRIISTFQQS
jgi:serine/threonine protein kinase